MAAAPLLSQLGVSSQCLETALDNHRKAFVTHYLISECSLLPSRTISTAAEVHAVHALCSGVGSVPEVVFSVSQTWAISRQTM